MSSPDVISVEFTHSLKQITRLTYFILSTLVFSTKNKKMPCKDNLCPLMGKRLDTFHSFIKYPLNIYYVHDMLGVKERHWGGNYCEVE